MLGAFPELRPAHERFLADWGLGEAPGEYVHLDLLDTLIELSLLKQASPARDALLARAFDFIEGLLGSPESEVRNLGYVGILESRAPWWYFRAFRFLGSASRSALDQHALDWRSSAEASHGVVPPSEEREAERADPWGVREIVDSLLGGPAA